MMLDCNWYDLINFATIIDYIKAGWIVMELLTRD